MITRILFPHKRTFKPSEDTGLRNTLVGSLQKAIEVYCLPGSYNGANGTTKSEQLNRIRQNELKGKHVPTKLNRKKPLVLHVEDNKEIRFLVNILLRNDFDVHGSETGEVALDMIQKHDYDIILMDLNLGEGLSGIEVTAQIRKNNRLESIPVIAVTANNYNEVREDCIEAGMSAFIQKPFDKADLIATIHELTIN